MPNLKLDSLNPLVRQAFQLILIDPQLSTLKDNDLQSNIILERINDILSEKSQSQKTFDSQQLMTQSSLLKDEDFSANKLKTKQLSHDRSIQELKISQENQRVSLVEAQLKEEMNMQIILNEQLIIANKEGIHGQDILKGQISELQCTFQLNLEEMRERNECLLFEIEKYKDKLKKSELSNQLLNQQMKDGMYLKANQVWKQQTFQAIENTVGAETNHINQYEINSQNQRAVELEQQLRETVDEIDNKQSEIVFLNKVINEQEKSIKLVENKLTEKIRAIEQIQMQHEQTLTMNEENQKSFFFNTVSKYKGKVQFQKIKNQEHLNELDYQNQSIYQLQLEGNEIKNCYQKHVQHIESSIQHVQSQYETIIFNLKSTAKNELDRVMEGCEKDLKYKDLQHAKQLAEFQFTMQERIQEGDQKSVMKTAVDVQNNEKTQKQSKEKNNLVNRQDEIIKIHIEQNFSLKEQVMSLTNKLCQIEQMNKYNGDELIRENENKIIQAEINSLEKMNRDLTLKHDQLQLKHDQLKIKLNQLLQTLQINSDNQNPVNHQLRQMCKDSEFDCENDQKLIQLQEKCRQNVQFDCEEADVFQNTYIILQNKIVSLNARLNQVNKNLEEVSKEKQRLYFIIETQNKQIRFADDFKLKFTIKIQNILKDLQQIKGEITNKLKKDFIKTISLMRLSYETHIEELINRLEIAQNKSKQEQTSFDCQQNQMKEEMKEEISRFYLTFQNKLPHYQFNSEEGIRIDKQNQQIEEEDKQTEGIVDIRDQERVDESNKYQRKHQQTDSEINSNKSKIGINKKSQRFQLTKYDNTSNICQQNSQIQQYKKVLNSDEVKSLKKETNTANINEFMWKQAHFEENCFLKVYIIDDIKRIKNENASMIEERSRLIMCLDGLAMDINAKQSHIDTLSSQIHLILKEMEQVNQENIEMRVKMREDDRNQELIKQCNYELQLTIQNSSLENQVFELGLKVQSLTKELSDVHLKTNSDKEQLKQLLHRRKARLLQKSQQGPDKIKEIYQMIKNNQSVIQNNNLGLQSCFMTDSSANYNFILNAQSNNLIKKTHVRAKTNNSFIFNDQNIFSNCKSGHLQSCLSQSPQNNQTTNMTLVSNNYQKQQKQDSFISQQNDQNKKYNYQFSQLNKTFNNQQLFQQKNLSVHSISSLNQIQNRQNTFNLSNSGCGDVNHSNLFDLNPNYPTNQMTLSNQNKISSINNINQINTFNQGRNSNTFKQPIYPFITSGHPQAQSVPPTIETNLIPAQTQQNTDQRFVINRLNSICPSLQQKNSDNNNQLNTLPFNRDINDNLQKNNLNFFNSRNILQSTQRMQGLNAMINLTNCISKIDQISELQNDNKETFEQKIEEEEEFNNSKSSKYEQLHVSSENNFTQTQKALAVETIKSENIDYISNLQNLQKLDQFIIRSRSQSSDFIRLQNQTKDEITSSVASLKIENIINPSQIALKNVDLAHKMLNLSNIKQPSTTINNNLHLIKDNQKLGVNNGNELLLKNIITNKKTKEYQNILSHIEKSGQLQRNQTQIPFCNTITNQQHHSIIQPFLKKQFYQSDQLIDNYDIFKKCNQKE